MKQTLKITVLALVTFYMTHSEAAERWRPLVAGIEFDADTIDTVRTKDGTRYTLVWLHYEDNQLRTLLMRVRAICETRRLFAEQVLHLIPDGTRKFIGASRELDTSPAGQWENPLIEICKIERPWWRPF